MDRRRIADELQCDQLNRSGRVVFGCRVVVAVHPGPDQYRAGAAELARAIDGYKVQHRQHLLHLLQRGVNEGLAIEGVVLTMYDARLNLSRQVAADAREYFGPQVFQSVVPRNVRLAEAPSFGKPILLYDVASIGAQAYMSIARELIERPAREGDGAVPTLVST
jgi:MinD-like ATPase involved in chromosome partitioning or flagellar assembly